MQVKQLVTIRDSGGGGNNNSYIEKMRLNNSNKNQLLTARPELVAKSEALFRAGVLCLVVIFRRAGSGRESWSSWLRFFNEMVTREN